MVPWRYSPVVPMIPRISRNVAATPAPAIPSRKSCAVLKSLVAKPAPWATSVSTTIAIRKPSAVRVVQASAARRSPARS